MNNPEEPKSPTMFNMISSFARDLKTYIASGAPNVTTEDYVGSLVKPQMRCGLCGCMLEHKAKWKTTTCPDKPTRWKKQIINGLEQESNNTDISDKA